MGNDTRRIACTSRRSGKTTPINTFLLTHLFVFLSHTKTRIRSQKMDLYNSNSQRAFVLYFQICLFSQLELYFQFHFYWNNWLHGKSSESRIWFGCLLSRCRTNTSAILEWQSWVSRESWSTRSRFLSYLQWWCVISWMRKQCRYDKNRREVLKENSKLIDQHQVSEFCAFFITKLNHCCRVNSLHDRLIMKLMSKFNVCVVGAIMIGFITESVESLLFSQFTLFQVSLTNRATKFVIQPIALF